MSGQASQDGEKEQSNETLHVHHTSSSTLSSGVSADAGGPADLDMRAEVGVANRSLIITGGGGGDVAGGVGAHVVVNGSASANISNVQFLRCGQVRRTPLPHHSPPHPFLSYIPLSSADVSRTHNLALNCM